MFASTGPRFLKKKQEIEAAKGLLGYVARLLIVSLAKALGVELFSLYGEAPVIRVFSKDPASRAFMQTPREPITAEQ